MVKLRKQTAGRLLALLGILILDACVQQQEVREPEFQVPVSVEEVGLGTVEDVITTTGTLRAAQSVVLRVETGGLLTIAHHGGRRLAEGDAVSAGTTIAEVSGEDARVEAGIEAAQQRHDMAVWELERTRRLVKEGIVPEEQLRQKESQVAEAELALDRSRLTNTRSRLVTPISGTLLELGRDEQGLPIADGQLVSRGTVIARVAPIKSLIADVDILGPDLGRVRTGLDARLRYFAFDRQTFPGTLKRLAPSLDPQTHTLRAEVEVDNAAGLLRPGMFVEVEIVTERREQVPVIPREALAVRGGKNVVFVLAGSTVERREVIVGLGDDARVEIRQGLEPGEKVVVRGLETLTAGTRVRVTS